LVSRRIAIRPQDERLARVLLKRHQDNEPRAQEQVGKRKGEKLVLFGAATEKAEESQTIETEIRVEGVARQTKSQLESR